MCQLFKVLLKVRTDSEKQLVSQCSALNYLKKGLQFESFCS